MKKKIKITNFKQVKEILYGEESYTRNGIRIKFNSRIPLFFEYSKLPSSLIIEKEEYKSAVSYMEKIMDEHAKFYNARSIIDGSYECSGEELQKHHIKFGQILEIVGVGEKHSNKMLEVLISFQKY